jgi:DNA-binding transcriptional ArsR family regulator
MARGYARALPRAWQGLARVFTSLGDEQRQRILLMFERGEELSMKQVVARVTEAKQMSRTAVVHHIGVLRDAGVLAAERRGKEVYLRPEPRRVLEAIEGLRGYIKEEYRL